MELKRVVVTGLGAVSPLGKNVKENWENALQGKSGAAKISRFAPGKFKTMFACEVKDFDPSLRLDRHQIKRSDLFTQFALYATAEAMEDTGLDINTMNPFDIGVVWGTGQGGMTTFESEVKSYVAQAFQPRFNPFFIPRLITNMASGMISMKYGLMGINYTAVSACATSNTAIMDAFNYIRLGKAKVIITGGSEAPINESSIGGFNAMKALSTRNEDPASASRPFDVERDGFVMGEGGASLILEEYEHARKRGAHIYAEIAGAAMTADAYHMTATHPEGLGAYEAMRQALEEAKLSIFDVDYLNAHATSTGLGDVSEIKAIARHLGDKKNQLHISATKSMTGHLLGAAGAIEAIFSIMSIQDNIIPPTINTSNPDPAIPANIQVVYRQALQKNVDAVISDTFGFGGHNCAVIFKKLN